MATPDVTERLRETCAEVGFELDRAKPSIVSRLRLLAEHTETINDCERMAATAHDVFHYYETTKPLEAFTEAERRIVVLGCLFSDIGKTGPGSADASGQRLIVEMFGVEGVRDDKQPIARFLKAHFHADADARIQRFAALGLDPGMSLREFWNLHSAWTLEIVEAGEVPPEAIAAAATHHLLEDINPERIVGPDLRFTRSFGDNEAFDRAEMLVILLDKYDAVRRRGQRTHDQAIAWLRDRVAKNPHFHGDAQLTTLIADLDNVLSVGMAHESPNRV